MNFIFYCYLYGQKLLKYDPKIGHCHKRCFKEYNRLQNKYSKKEIFKRLMKDPRVRKIIKEVDAKSLKKIKIN